MSETSIWVVYSFDIAGLNSWNIEASHKEFLGMKTTSHNIFLHF